MAAALWRWRADPNKALITILRERERGYVELAECGGIFLDRGMPLRAQLFRLLAASATRISTLEKPGPAVVHGSTRFAPSVFACGRSGASAHSASASGPHPGHTTPLQSSGDIVTRRGFPVLSSMEDARARGSF